MSLNSAPESTKPFKSSDYPRTYQPSKAKKLLIFALGGILLLGGGGFLRFSWVLWAEHQDTISAMVFALLSLPILLLSIKLILEALRSKFILLPDAIESHGAFFTKILRRYEIEGYSRTRAERTPAIEFWPKRTPLIPESMELKMIRIFMTFTPDSAFDGWLSGLKNFDEEESKSGVYVYSSPFSPEAIKRPRPRGEWFRTAPTLGPIVALTVLYSLAVTNSPTLLEWMNSALTPLVDALKFIGLAITKSCMDGPLPEQVYVNVVGISVWGAVIYNVRTVWFCITHKQWRVASNNASREAEQRLMARHGWGRLQAWLAIRAIMLFVLIPLIVCFTLALLNGGHGWFVVHISDYLWFSAWPLCFVLLPGMVISILSLSVIRCVVYDFISLKNLFLPQFRG